MDGRGRSRWDAGTRCWPSRGSTPSLEGLDVCSVDARTADRSRKSPQQHQYFPSPTPVLPSARLANQRGLDIFCHVLFFFFFFFNYVCASVCEGHPQSGESKSVISQNFFFLFFFRFCCGQGSASHGRRDMGVTRNNTKTTTTTMPAQP